MASNLLPGPAQALPPGASPRPGRVPRSGCSPVCGAALLPTRGEQRPLLPHATQTPEPWSGQAGGPGPAWWAGEGPGEGPGVPGMDPPFCSSLLSRDSARVPALGGQEWWPGPGKSRGAWGGTGLLNRGPSKTKPCGLAAPPGLSKDLPAALPPHPHWQRRKGYLVRNPLRAGRAGRPGRPERPGRAGRPGGAGRPEQARRPGWAGRLQEVLQSVSLGPTVRPARTWHTLTEVLPTACLIPTPHMSPHYRGAPT